MYQPVWITIPAGRFSMGSDPRLAAPPFANEFPQQQITLPTFQISRVPITNAHYHRFITATGHTPPGHWPHGAPPPHSDDHPVTYVSWHDAAAFCAWAGVRLPTEAEWERAAAGGGLDTAPRSYPWGDAAPTAQRLNFRRDGIRATTTPVDRYRQGATPEGIFDMAGNVWEWCHTLYAPYPYDATDGRETLYDPVQPATHGPRVLRGGSFLSPSAAFVRCAMRSLSYPTRRREHIGFRVAPNVPR